MKSSRLVSVAASIFLALSTLKVEAGTTVVAHPSSGGNPAVVWAVFGCAAGIILAALDANRRQHRQLTPYEVATCGVAYWFTVKYP